MDYRIFLDTNIYDAKQYSFNNASFSFLRSKGRENEIKIIINSIVNGEVRQHIKTNVKKAAKELLNAVKQKELAGFRHAGSEYNKYLNIPAPNDWVDKALASFEDFLEECNFELITTNGINVEQIISDYFNVDPPFTSQKKEEFKDAMIISAIMQDLSNLAEYEMYCIVSEDEGFLQGVLNKLSGNTVYNKGKVKTFSKLDELLDFMNNNYKMIDYIKSGKIENIISDAVEKAFYDARINIESLYIDTEDETIEDIVDITAKPYLISVDDETAIVSFEIQCKVYIDYTFINEEASYYDKEERMYLWIKEIERYEAYIVNFSIVLSLDISSYGSNGEIAFREYIEMPTQIDLEEQNLLKSNIVKKNGPFYMAPNGYKAYAETTCPDCGKPIGIYNDGGNGFCINCAGDH